MRCKQIVASMSAYLDGYLDDETQRAFEAHVAECGVCRNELDALRKTVSFLRAVEPLDAPRDLVERIHSVVDVARAQSVSEARMGFGQRMWRLNATPLRAALAACLVLALTFVVVRNVPRQVRPEARAMTKDESDRVKGVRGSRSELVAPPASVASEEQRPPTAAVRPAAPVQSARKAAPEMEAPHEPPVAIDVIEAPAQSMSAAHRERPLAGPVDRRGRAQRLRAGGDAAESVTAQDAMSKASAALPSKGDLRDAALRADTLLGAIQSVAVRVDAVNPLEKGDVRVLSGQTPLRSLWRAEMSDGAYKELKQVWSAVPGVSFVEEAATNGRVTVLISFSWGIETRKEIK